jgi:hypothetical protein
MLLPASRHGVEFDPGSASLGLGGRRLESCLPDGLRRGFCELAGRHRRSGLAYGSVVDALHGLYDREGGKPASECDELLAGTSAAELRRSSGLSTFLYVRR